MRLNKQLLPLAYVLACILLLGVGIACLFSGMKTSESGASTVPDKSSVGILPEPENTLAPDVKQDAEKEETVSAVVEKPNAIRDLTDEEKYLLEHPEEAEQEEKENGSFLTEIKGKDKLPEGGAEVLTGFLDGYFQTQQSFPARFKSLALIEVADQTKWFADPEGLKAGIWQNAVLYQCAAKTANCHDLSLTSCSYYLEIGNVTALEDGDLKVEYEESFEMAFRYLKGLVTKQQGLDCSLVLRETPDGWRIVSYYREEDFFSAINTYVNDDTRVEDLPRLCANAFERYCKNYLGMMKSRDAVNAGEVTYEPADHGYDREAAATYIARFWEQRNPEYSAYDGLGGNCQNFTSQMLRAGGIPMDVSGMSRWKYYGDYWDDSVNSSGRTGSWTGAPEFHIYAKENTGYGLAAIVDFSPFAAEPGDVFQVGVHSDDIGHSNVVLGPYEENGKIVEILLNSNSNNRENWPMTVTFSANVSLIKIRGWNN
ncbi:MAG: amidase domain-containing protein [Oscillospiraceae bacterium]|nr:amidase domain-containing protein [Oscillospiraceae bacterium]